MKSTKTIIEEATLHLLSTEGLDGFTAANLARAAGISKATIYHHFDSLDDILIAAFERFALDMAALRPEEGISLRDWLIALGEESFAMGEKHRQATDAYMVFFAKSLSDPRLNARVVSVLDGVYNAIFDILSMLVKGPLNPKRHEAMVAMIVASLDGMAMHTRVLPNRAEALQAAWKMMVDSIAPE